VIGEHDLDGHAVDAAAEILDRHPGREHGALPGEIGVEARLVVEHPDLDLVVGHRGRCRAGNERQGRHAREQIPDPHEPHPVLASWWSQMPRYSCSVSMRASSW
jgi:hypothetical protein